MRRICASERGKGHATLTSAARFRDGAGCQCREQSKRRVSGNYPQRVSPRGVAHASADKAPHALARTLVATAASRLARLQPPHAPPAQRTWYIWRKYVSSSSRVAVLADTPSSPSGTGSPQNCSGDRSANCLPSDAGAEEALPLAGARRAAAARPRIGARKSMEVEHRGAPLKAASMADTARKSVSCTREFDDGGASRATHFFRDDGVTTRARAFYARSLHRTPAHYWRLIRQVRLHRRAFRVKLSSGFQFQSWCCTKHVAARSGALTCPSTGLCLLQAACYAADGPRGARMTQSRLF